MASELSTYTWTDKSNAVSLYMATGNLRLVSEKHDIPYAMLHDWKKQEWWGQIVDELRIAKKAAASKKIDKVLESGIEAIQDRLDNGDFILNNKTGKIERKPVSLRDATQVTNALMTRQIQMEEQAARLDTQETSMKDMLGILAKEFQKFNRLQKNVVDVESKEI